MISARLFAACSIAALAASTGRADDPSAPTQTPNSEFNFIKVNCDYAIRFADDNEFIKSARRDDAPVVEIFRVTKRGGGSWVLLEHPASPRDVASWNRQRRAMAHLTEQRIAQLQADPAGAERLQELRDAASRSLKTAKTWVNLAHAFAISDVPTHPVDTTKLSVTLEAVVEE